MHATRTRLLEGEYRARCSLHERLQRQVVLLQDSIQDLSQIKAQIGEAVLAEGSGATLQPPLPPHHAPAAARG
jgi:hypothetical protein